MSPRVRVTHTELVHHVHKQIHGRIGVYLRREAMLSPDLSAIDEREVLAIRIVDMDGYQGEQAWDLLPQDASALYRALGDAVMIANTEGGTTA